MRIAVSGPTACGNSTASELVSKKLKLKKYNYTFHDLAKDLGMPFSQLHLRAEEDDAFDRALDKKQIGFALDNDNCIVGTRLAVFLDKIAPKLGMEKPHFDLKVWLEAPERVRAGRLAKRDGKSLGEALEEVSYRDSSNALRYKKLYSIAYAKPKGCLVVNNSKLSAEDTARAIIDAARRVKPSR